MAFIRHTKDAEFYSLVHSVLAGSGNASCWIGVAGGGMRFRGAQVVAPWKEGKLPEKDDFQRVQCIDLSPSGLAYLADEPPTSPRLIIVLAVAPWICLLANVVRHDAEVHGDRTRHRVACRFSKRIGAHGEADGGGGW